MDVVLIFLLVVILVEETAINHKTKQVQKFAKKGVKKIKKRRKKG
jgi:hypothetical protein